MRNRKREKRYSMFMDTCRRVARNKLAVLGAILLLALVLAAVFADFIAPYSETEMDLGNLFQTPSPAHWFGTDNFGRDIFSRVIYGSRISLFIFFIAVGISLLFGAILGAVAGYYGKAADMFIMRLMDVVAAVPSVLLAIAVVAALGTGLRNMMIATGISFMPGYARIVRASVLSLKDQEFVEAARAIGTPNSVIITRHILPNCLAPLLVQATFGVAIAILTIAGLSFMGLGLQPPSPEWGAMLSTGRDFIRNYPHMTIFPGLAIAVTIFSLNVLGDGLRDALDPKLRD